jgi:hypothetical protein
MVVQLSVFSVSKSGPKTVRSASGGPCPPSWRSARMAGLGERRSGPHMLGWPRPALLWLALALRTWHLLGPRVQSSLWRSLRPSGLRGGRNPVQAGHLFPPPTGWLWLASGLTRPRQSMWRGGSHGTLIPLPVSCIYQSHNDMFLWKMFDLVIPHWDAM